MQRPALNTTAAREAFARGRLRAGLSGPLACRPCQAPVARADLHCPALPGPPARGRTGH